MTEEEAIKKALSRERARRRKAEMLLEEKSRELFESFEELRKTHAALKLNQSQLVQSEKMASLGIMSAGVAHEINNPASYALGNIRTLESELPALGSVLKSCRAFLGTLSESTEFAEAAASIEAEFAAADIDYLLEDIPDLLKETCDGLTRIRDIVGGLQDFAKREDSEREPISLEALAHAALILVRPNIPESLDVVETYQNLPDIEASKTGISQVILNLLRNAVEAIQETAEDRDSARDRIEIATSTRDGHVCLSVRDSGCGMTPEQLGKLFTPFFTTKEVGKGTGLGLSAALGIVEEHGGRIEVASEQGAGSCFEVLLPISEEQ